MYMFPSRVARYVLVSFWTLVITDVKYTIKYFMKCIVNILDSNNHSDGDGFPRKHRTKMCDRCSSSRSASKITALCAMRMRF